MAHPVRMPKPGQMTEECTITRWYKAEGDPVRRGDALFEIETDKATMDVEAFDEGVLLRRLVAEGDTVPVNTICAYIGEPGEAIPDGAPEPAPAPEATTEPAPPPPTAPAPAPTAPAPSRPAGAVSVPLRPASPSRAAGAHAGAEESGPPRLEAVAVASPAAGSGRISPVGPSVSPRAARLARARGVDLARLVGSGPGGRIVERDVLAAAAGSGATGGPAWPAEPRPPLDLVSRPSAETTKAAAGESEEEAPRPLSRIRRVIAERLTASWAATPQFSVTVAADVTPLAALRSELRAAGYDLSITDFVLAATAQTLVEFPDLNARTDGTLVWPRPRIHLGLAVAVPGGLLVPVIRDADRRSLLEIHAAAERLIAGARAGSLGPDELRGSTFTVSNLGMFGVERFEAIVNPGEAAILAVGSASPEVVVVGDGIGIRTVMHLTLSADHRLVDGELAARFLGSLRRRLVDGPGWQALLERS